VKRREFITWACGAAITWPPAVRAQTAKVPTIGVLLTGNPDPEIFLKGFRDALRNVGYTDGQNIRLEVRSAEGKSILLPQKAAELVGLKVDIIRRQARRPPCRAADQVRVGHKRKHCQGAWHHHSTDAGRACRRGDRIKLLLLRCMSPEL
jgi:hypothetical protein